MNALPVKISVIVPIYNVEEYLGACLSSCVNQTLHDIEIICVNDGSTDNSLAVLEAFAANDYRIQIISKPNGGLSSARNAGIRAARGSIIMFLDSDDYLECNACERVWIESMEAPTDIVIFGTAIFPDTPRASTWHYDVLRSRVKRYHTFSEDVLFKEKSAKPFVWRQAFSKRLFDEYGLAFDETVKYGEDMVFQMETFPHAANFAFISDSLYHYRWYRPGSLMSSVRDNMDQKIENHLYFVDIISEYWKRQGWLDLYGKAYTQWLLEFFIPDIRNKKTQHSQEHLKKFYALIRKYELTPYLRKMPLSVWPLVRSLKRSAK